MVGTTVVNTTSEERDQTPNYRLEEATADLHLQRETEIRAQINQNPTPNCNCNELIDPIRTEQQANWVGKKGRQLKAESLPLERRDDWWVLFSPATIPPPTTPPKRTEEEIVRAAGMGHI